MYTLIVETTVGTKTEKCNTECDVYAAYRSFVGRFNVKGAWWTKDGETLRHTII